MKANELMIGDWLKDQFGKGRPFKVSKEILIYILNGKDPFCTIDNVHPIPLTEEILKANKISYRLPKNGETFDKEWVIPNGAFHIRQDGSEFWLFEDQVSIRYVHELQHALRLCRLNDIADNLKIQ